MFVLPNSAPDSLTPKNWNFVRLPEHRLLDGAVAVEVPVALPAGLELDTVAVAVDG